MIVVTGTLEIDTADIGPAKEAAIAMMEETAKEDGCITYRFSHDIEYPERFRVYEEWESGEHLKAHFKTAHMARFGKALAALTVVSRDIKMFEAGAATKL